MTYPAIFYRETKHKKPKRQFYQPGFNAQNSCWFEGEWISVGDERWAQREEHQKVHAMATAEGQHYRNPGIPVDKMTPEQRQAWLFNSGAPTIDCIRNGFISTIRVHTGGLMVREVSVEWMRKDGYKALRVTRNPQGQIVHQLESCQLPENLISDELGADGQPINVWERIIAQNRARMREQAFELLDAVSESQYQGDSLMCGVALQQLIYLEKEMVTNEWHRSIGHTGDQFKRTDEELRAEYSETRQAFREKMPNFSAEYEKARVEHNECARANLDNSKGVLFNYVLPVFHPDGTHEPWGPRDVPWGALTVPVA